MKNNEKLTTGEEEPVVGSEVEQISTPSTEPTGNAWNEGGLDPETARAIGHSDGRLRREVEDWKLGKPAFEVLREKGDPDLENQIMRYGREEMLNKGFPNERLDEKGLQERIRELGTEALIQRLGNDIFLDMVRKEEIQAQRVEEERKELEEKARKRQEWLQGIEDKKPINRAKRFFKQMFTPRER